MSNVIRPKRVSSLDVAALLLLLEPAAHEFEGLEFDEDDPRSASVRDLLDDAIFAVEKLSEVTFETAEVDDDIAARLKKLLS
jgi:hypothetical protein